MARRCEALADEAASLAASLEHARWDAQQAVESLTGQNNVGGNEPSMAS